MAIFILIAIQIAIFALAFFAPIIAKVIMHFDYVFLFLLIWAFVFGAGGHNENGLLVNRELHTVFVISIYLAILGAWFGLQQIRVCNIYIFKIIACGFSAYIIVYMASTGWFGHTLADGMDLVWQWTAGIVYFGLALALRSRDSGLIRRRRPATAAYME